MKKIFYFLPVAAALTFTSCNAQVKTEEKSTTQTENTEVINKDVDVKTFAKGVEAGKGVLIDVRTDGEFAEGHLKGAKQIDISSNDFEEQLKKLDPEIPVYVYCRSGGRSGRAAHIMKGLGFKEVYNLEGGILAWEAEGKEIAK